MRLRLKNDEENVFPPPGFEPQSPGTKSNCATNELGMTKNIHPSKLPPSQTGFCRKIYNML